MSESLLGFNVADTRHTAGKSANGLAAGPAPPPRAGGAGICPAGTSVALVIVAPVTLVELSLVQAVASSAGPPCASTPDDHHALDNTITEPRAANAKLRSMRGIVFASAPGNSRAGARDPR
jgi:hypothetical protein